MHGLRNYTDDLIECEFHYYLGSGDFTNNLASVSGHDCVEGSGDSFDQAESAIFSHCQEQVLAQLVHLQLVTSGNKTLSL